MKNTAKKLGFTLIELVVVVVIIGILAAVTVSGHNRGRERAFDKQAQVILTAIRTAERNYWVENDVFWSQSPTSVDAININLGTDLANDGHWSYNIVPGLNDFTASISRDGAGFNRVWSISASSENATCSNNCP